MDLGEPTRELRRDHDRALRLDPSGHRQDSRHVLDPRADNRDLRGPTRHAHGLCARQEEEPQRYQPRDRAKMPLARTQQGHVGDLRSRRLRRDRG